MHTPTAQQPLRRLLDTTSQSLTITYAQVQDAVQRVFHCRPPKIVNGLWNVFQDQARAAAETQAAQQVAEQAARERTLRQLQLETAFAVDTLPAPAAPRNPLDDQLLSALNALEMEQQMARRLRKSLELKRTDSGEALLQQIQQRCTELHHRITELRALGATA